MCVFKVRKPGGKKDHLDHRVSLVESFKHETAFSGCTTHSEYQLLIMLKKHYHLHHMKCEMITLDNNIILIFCHTNCSG
jgi:hypothetical protein